MRAVAITVWVFLNLGFFGMCGYIYLMFSQYWYRASRQVQYDFRPKKRIYNPDNQVIFYDPVPTIKQEFLGPKMVKRKKLEKEVLPCDPYARDCKPLPKKINTYKNDLYVQLRRVLHEESSVFKVGNPYNVNYEGQRSSYVRKTAEDIRCALKSVGVRTLTQEDSPLDKMDIGKLLSSKKYLYNKRHNSCAIVSNAASLLNSSLGQLIDDHDIVVRFNHAPTQGYEADVGTKTTIRIVNSQVVAKDMFNFTTNELYKNVTIIVWDPSVYGADLAYWLNTPDYDFFNSWSQHRKTNNETDSFIVDPRSVWRLWDFIQSLIAQRIRRNPPSSGFIGIALMLLYCNYVDFYEYVPSIRQTKRCHYFDKFEDASCTFGVWHPLAAEKLLALAMNEANDLDVFQTGFIRIPGYPAQC